MNKKDLSKINLPDSPGVYFFRDDDKSKDELGNILYIGKATSLADRVKSYFAPDLKDARGLKIVNMVLAASDISYLVTDSVLEALLLENKLIKSHQPPFNTKEKDNKTYSCVVITKEEYPRVLVMRIREYEKRFGLDINKIDKVYGPFSSGQQIKDALRIIRKIFPFRDKCEVDQGVPCFNAQLKLCPGCCVGLISSSDYKVSIKHIKDFFEGSVSKIKRELTKEMEAEAKKENFEAAAKIRNTLWALTHIKDVSLIKNEELLEFKDKNFRIEAYDVAHISGSSRVGVMVVIEGGEKKKEEYRRFKLVEGVNDDYAGLMELLKRRFKHDEWSRPDLVVFDGGHGQKNIGEEVLSRMNILVPTCSVVKDDKHKARGILSSYPHIEKYKKYILLANAEAHRFAIAYHKERRGKEFLKG